MSFSNILKASSATAVSTDTPVATTMRAMSLSAVSETFNGMTRSDKYTWYENYQDENYSLVDSNKNIIIDETQINLTQEENSQFIPFKIPRYWDGIDLMDMAIKIRYVNEKKEENIVIPVNVQYNSEFIIFGWLVDSYATYLKGTLLFEIFATGVNEKGDNYVWRTRPNGKLNILESLVGNGMIEPDESWTMQFIRQMDEKIATAQDYMNQAKEAAINATNSASSVDDKITASAESITNNVLGQIENTLLQYYTKQEVDELLNNIDISSQLTDITNRVGTLEDEFNTFDGLAKLNIGYDKTTNTLSFFNGNDLIKSIALNNNPSTEWVTAYDNKVDNKISNAVDVIKEELNQYKEATNNDLQNIHNNIDNLPSTLESDYYNKDKTDELLLGKADKSALSDVSSKISVVESTANSNKENISSLGTKVSEIENTVNNIDTSPKLSYEATYDEEQIYTLWEIEGEGDSEVRTPKGQFKIQGGGGGTSTSSVLKIEYVTKTPLVATVNDKVLISYNFSGTDSSGDAVMEGTATWKINNTLVATNTAVSGENTFDITEYVSLGTQKVILTIVDNAGSLVTKSWTVQKIDIRLESSFNDKLTYPIGTISFDYTPYGAVSKIIHFILDGKEIGTVTTNSSGIPMSYTLPSQSHGAHLLEVYITAEINGNTVESNHILKDILWYDASSDIPVIGCVQQEFTVMQYDTINIVYTVHDPNTESPKVILAVDDNIVSTLTLDSNTQTWQYKTSDLGEHILTITCGVTVKTLKVTVEKLDIDIEPITANLVFDFNPIGKSNNDADRLWSYGEISMTVSDNFDWVNGGYQIDENGEQYFCIKAGTSAEINHKLFADDAKKNGKEFKLVFKTTNVARPDAKFLNCIDNTTGDNRIGIEMFVHEANIYAQSGRLDLAYSEEDIIEFEFNISKNTEDIPMVMGYEDGVSTRPMVYDDSHSFTQNNPEFISLGSPDCDLHIYRFKVYNTSLTDRGILNNFIADARSAEEMIKRYNYNQIYDENQMLTPEVLAEKCPWLRVYKVSAPYFTNNKSDKVPGTTIQQIYKNGDPVLDNWTCHNSQHSGQGTSSNNYGAAGSSLGLVKTGGDVTISNGVVTVNDDSHNHVISNIDGLQSALDGKAKVYKLAKSANLNDIITPGFYNVGGSNTITNKPSGVDSFGLIVIHRASGSYYTQILYYSQNSYRRHCENGTWSSWTQDKLTDTDTWRGIQNNLTSDSTSDSLSAAQGKALKTLIDCSTISQSDIDAIFV